MSGLGVQEGDHDSSPSIHPWLLETRSISAIGIELNCIERDIIFIGTPNLCSPHHRHRPTVILVASYAARVDMKRKLFRLT